MPIGRSGRREAYADNFPQCNSHHVVNVGEVQGKQDYSEGLW
ncbi:hypothetical protein [Sulfolobus acidocaldarius]|nr:hypothetical protein [Sulfolobus acidocaldarius]